MMKDTLISIVCPVYNVEEYLRRTIDGVLNQTYQNWELILVDDGSKDKSGDICDEYAKKCDRIRVIRKQNGGVSSARNVGIDNSKGEWICFLDSDDAFHDCYLSNFINLITDESDLLLQSFQVCNTLDNTSKSVVLPDGEIKGGYNLIRFLEEYPGVHNGFIWHRLFRKSIIEKNNLRFAEGISFAEDGLFFFEYMRFVNQCIQTSRVGYIYYIRSGSLTTKKNKIGLDIFKTVFEGYMDALLLIPIPSVDKEDFDNFILKYSWRLAENWFVRRGYYNGDKEAKILSETLINKYHLQSVKGVSLSLHLLGKAFEIKNRNIRSMVVSGIELFRITIAAIKNRI